MDAFAHPVSLAFLLRDPHGFQSFEGVHSAQVSKVGHSKLLAGDDGQQRLKTEGEMAAEQGAERPLREPAIPAGR